jgi:hypothetical protein
MMLKAKRVSFDFIFYNFGLTKGGGKKSCVKYLSNTGGASSLTAAGIKTNHFVLCNI